MAQSVGRSLVYKKGHNLLVNLNNLLQCSIVSPQSFSWDLVLLADFNTRLFQNLQPWMSQSLSYAHTFLRLVDQQISNKMFGLSWNVLPQFKVKINITHLDTLQGFTIILQNWKKNKKNKKCDKQTLDKVSYEKRL